MGTAEPWRGRSVRQLRQHRSCKAPRCGDHRPPMGTSPASAQHPPCTYPLPRPFGAVSHLGEPRGNQVERPFLLLLESRGMPAAPLVFYIAKFPCSCLQGGQRYALAGIYYVHTECLKKYKYRFPVFTYNPQQPKRHIFTAYTN